MVEKYKNSIVRIVSEPKKFPVGAGVLIGPRLVITCAHVVNSALLRDKYSKENPLDNPISIDFPFTGRLEWIFARVIEWLPIDELNGGDIALLELDSDPPENAEIAGFSKVISYLGHTFQAFGFPEGQIHGRDASGVLKGGNSIGRVMLERVNIAQKFIESGFSGTGVFDDVIEEFVGIIAEADQDTMAFMIPTSKIWSFFENFKISITILPSSPKPSFELLKKPIEENLLAQNESRFFSKNIKSEIEMDEKINIPAKIGRYILHEPIGIGNSPVYKAFDPELARFVAIKIFHIPESQNISTAKRSFLLEAQMLAKFQHEYIVIIYDVGIQEKYCYLVMEFLQGEPLITFFQEGHLMWNKALKLLLPACEALAQAHQQGIIHRDIKPANMIVGSNEKIKLLDFGLAFDENLSLRSDEDSFIGTFAYASPEQFRSQPLSYQTDVYSFALILLEAITGQNPQKTAYEKGDLHAIISHPYDFKGFESLIPPQLQKILAIALNKEPQARYSNCQELFEALEACYLNPPNESATIIPIEPPTGAVPISSSFYIERKADHVLINQIIKPGTITTIRAGRQTGKTSLLLRGIRLAQKNQLPVVKIDFQQAQKEHLETLESLLYYIALETTLQTNQEVSVLDNFWKLSLPLGTKFNRFFKGKILSQIPSSLILAIDEADKLSEYSHRKDFFALLRSWNAEQAMDEEWAKLRLILVISTHPLLLIDNIHQSPFNVGLTIHLEDFDAEQVADLIRRHGNPRLENQVSALMGLVGGHPYLVRQALYTMTMNEWRFEELKQHALDSQGPFEQHLRFYREALRGNDELNKAFQQIIKNGKCPEEKIKERLISVGLIKETGNFCEPRCQLYADYFGKGR